jgi:hypothetical protein
MNNCFSCTSALLAMGIDDIFLTGKDAIPFIIIMSIFVFGLLLFKKVVRTPQRLFTSAFISYILMILIDFCFYLGCVCFPDSNNILLNIITFLCILVVLPNFRFFNLLEELFPVLLYRDPVVFQTMLYLMTFLMNILYIFWIIKLILFIRYKISAKKT